MCVVTAPIKGGNVYEEMALPSVAALGGWFLERDIG